MPSIPTLTARFERLESTLRIAYTVLNPGHDTVYLTNHACRVDAGGPVPDHNEAFVFIEDRVVHVTKRIPPPPPAFHNPIPHFVTPLHPGRDFSETIVLDLPIQPKVPYRRVQLTAVQIQATHVTFSVGYKLANPLVQAVQASRAGREVYLLRSTLQKGQRRPEGLIEPVEQFLQSPRQELVLPVLTGTPQTP